jgi:hypothetical protein
MSVLDKFRKKKKEEAVMVSISEQKDAETKPFTVPEKPLTTEEKLDKILAENRALRKELLTNRVIDTVILVIVLLYINFRITNLQDIVGTLVEIFMGGLG